MTFTLETQHVFVIPNEDNTIIFYHCKNWHHEDTKECSTTAISTYFLGLFLTKINLSHLRRSVITKISSLLYHNSTKDPCELLTNICLTRWPSMTVNFILNCDRKIHSQMHFLCSILFHSHITEENTKTLLLLRCAFYFTIIERWCCEDLDLFHMCLVSSECSMCNISFVIQSFCKCFTILTFIDGKLENYQRTVRVISLP